MGAVDSPRSVAQALAAEQTRLLVKKGWFATAANLALASVFAVAFGLEGVGVPALIPFAVVAVASVVRFGVLARGRSLGPTQLGGPRWRSSYIAVVSLTGAGWGLMGLLTYPHLAAGHQLVVLMTTFGMTAAGLSALVPVFWAYAAYLAPYFLGVECGVAIWGFGDAPWVPYMLPLYLLVMLKTGRESARAQTSALSFFLENQTLVGDLTEARDRAETARARAELASIAKTDFLAKMSHEIRTPMNGILGMTELLLTGTLAAEERSFAETAHQSGQSLLSIINDILDFSKIEAGKVVLAHDNFNLEGVVEEVMSLFGVAAARKGIELRYRLDPDVARSLVGDPVRLRQILANLVGNALKFTERGEVLVHVEAMADGHRFSVRDHGIGIDLADQARLFDSFEQANNSISRRFGGTGLGLSIVRQLVELMGGRVEVESALGSGSTFSFTLALPVHELRDAPPRDLLGERFVVAADHVGDREVVAGWLKARGADVSIAGDPVGLQAAIGSGIEKLVLDGGWFERVGVECLRASGVKVVVFEAPTKILASTDDRVIRVATPLRRSSFEAALKALSAASGARSASGSRRFAGAKVLVADDNAVNRAVVRGMLGRLGCVPELVDGGRAALDALSRRSFDLVLMDCEMPDLDGLSTTIEARKRERAADHNPLPIVALTAHALEAYRTQCLAAGMNDVLTKPIGIAGLERCLERWIIDASGSPAAVRRSSALLSTRMGADAPRAVEADAPTS